MRWTAVLLACWMAAGPAGAQSPAPVAVSLGLGIAGPGEEAVVPVTLSNPGSSPVAGFLLEVSFPAGSIRFHAASKAEAADSLDLDLETALTNQGEEELLTVQLSSKLPLPPGELVGLGFQVSREALPNQEFLLRATVREVRTPDGARLPSKSEDGSILVAVMGSVIPACFFYLH